MKAKCNYVLMNDATSRSEFSVIFAILSTDMLSFASIVSSGSAILVS